MLLLVEDKEDLQKLKLKLRSKHFIDALGQSKGVVLQAGLQ